MQCPNPQCDATVKPGAAHCPQCRQEITPGKNRPSATRPSGPPQWSIGPFLLRAIPWTLAAFFFWKYTIGPNADFTVWLTKALHRWTDFPAPYLYCDASRFFWHATLFPPVIGLTLASYWLSWPQRIIRAVGGYVAYCCLTAITIAIHVSPYLPENDIRLITTNTLVNANYLTFGLVIWVLACGPWYMDANRLSSGKDHRAKPRHSSRIARIWSIVRYGWVTRLLLLTFGIALILPLFAMTGTSEGMTARLEMAGAIGKIPFFPHPSNALMEDVTPDEQWARDQRTVEAVALVRQVIEEDKTDGFRAAYLHYLAGHLLYSLRHPDEETAQHLWKTGKAHILKSAELRRQRR